MLSTEERKLSERVRSPRASERAEFNADEREDPICGNPLPFLSPLLSVNGFISACSLAHASISGVGVMYGIWTSGNALNSDSCMCKSSSKCCKLSNTENGRE